MRTSLAGIGKALIALLFAVALTFAVSQVLSANSGADCDTPTGVCIDNEDCLEACMTYNGTEFGGWCLSGGCCLCLE